MRTVRPLPVVLLLVGVAASALGAGPASGSPEEEWQPFPEDASPTPTDPGVTVPAAGLAPPAPGTADRQEAGEVSPAPLSVAEAATPGGGVSLAPPAAFNRISLFGGHALGAGHGAVGVSLGFPLVLLRASLGLLSRWDVGLGFDSFYGVMNELRLTTRYTFFQGQRFAWALVAEGGRAFFTQRAAVESGGARWLTGRRNWNVVPGIVMSVQGATPDSARLFVDVRYQLGIDEETFQRDPLGGLPPPVAYVHSVPVRFGAELPFSPSASFLAHFGFDLHLDPHDAPFMPMVGVGVVAGF